MTIRYCAPGVPGLASSCQHKAGGQDDAQAIRETPKSDISRPSLDTSKQHATIDTGRYCAAQWPVAGSATGFAIRRG